MSSESIGSIGHQPLAGVRPEVPDTQATNPGRLNRQSVSALSDAEPMLKLTLSKQPKKTLSEFKITYSDNPDRKVGRTKQPLTLSKVLTQNATKIQSHQKRVHELKVLAHDRKENATALSAVKQELTAISKLMKSAAAEARSSAVTLAAAELSGQEVALTPTEVEALKQVEDIQALKAEYKEVQTEAKAFQAQIRKEERTARKLNSAMDKLETKQADVRTQLNRERVSDSVAGHKDRVTTLIHVKKEVAALASQLKGFDSKVKGAISGAVSDSLIRRRDALKSQLDLLQGKVRKTLQQARQERDTVVAAAKKEQKQREKEDKAFAREIRDVLKKDRMHDQRIQEKHKELARQKPASSQPLPKTVKAQPAKASNPSPQRSNAVRKRPATSALPSMPAAKQKKSESIGTTLAGGLMDVDLIDHMVGVRGTTKTYAALKNQILNVQTFKDIKQVIADRHASKLTPNEQRSYYGLMMTLIVNAPKKPSIGITPDFIKVVLKDEPAARRQALGNFK